MSAKKNEGFADKFDTAMLRIDAALGGIHERVDAVRADSGNTPTQGFSPERMKRTRMSFQAMSESSLLNDAGDDIKLGSGAHALPKAEADKPGTTDKRTTKRVVKPVPKPA